MEVIDELLTRAIGHYDRAEWCEVESLCRQVLAIAPEESAAFHLLGLVGLDRRDAAAATSWLERAVAAAPDDAEAWNDLGDALQRLDRVPEARAAFSRAAGLVPDFAEAHSNVGFMLFREGEYAAALEPLRRAVSLAPRFSLAALNLSSALLALGRDGEATEVLVNALAANPREVDLHVNLGQALVRCQRHAEAIAVLETGTRLAPERAALWLNLGIAHKDLNDLERAAAAYRQAIRLEPEYAEAHWNLALVLLTQGDLAAGWEEFEWRRRIRGIRPDRLPSETPEWSGGSLTNRTLLLIAEQGLGDTLQFIRYVAPLRALGARVVAAVQRPLLAILSGCEGIDELVAHSDPFPRHDLFCPLLSVPRWLSPDLEAIPWAGPYVAASPELVEDWRRRLTDSPHSPFRIGIGWQGNPNYAADRYRSVPLECFRPLANVPGVQLISLQQGFGVSQLRDPGRTFPVRELEPAFDTTAGPFMDTAAVMKNLDLVVVSDSSLVHLAGALGVPTWMPTSATPDWRWLLRGDTSPWYPTLRLFRQQQRSQWDGVFAAMRGMIPNAS